MPIQVVLNDVDEQSPILMRPAHGMSDDEYYDFCAANPDLQIERTAAGEILIMPPCGGETSNRNIDLSAQLQMWAKRDRRGKAFDSSAEFLLPNGAARSPDASWVLKTRLAALSPEQKERLRAPPVRHLESRPVSHG